MVRRRVAWLCVYSPEVNQMALTLTRRCIRQPKCGNRLGPKAEPRPHRLLNGIYTITRFRSRNAFPEREQCHPHAQLAATLCRVRPYLSEWFLDISLEKASEKRSPTRPKRYMQLSIPRPIDVSQYLSNVSSDVRVSLHYKKTSFRKKQRKKARNKSKKNSRFAGSLWSNSRNFSKRPAKTRIFQYDLYPSHVLKFRTYCNARWGFVIVDANWRRGPN